MADLECEESSYKEGNILITNRLTCIKKREFNFAESDAVKKACTEVITSSEREKNTERLSVNPANRYVMQVQEFLECNIPFSEIYICNNIIKKTGTDDSTTGEATFEKRKIVSEIVQNIISENLSTSYSHEMVTYHSAALEFEQFIKYIEYEPNSNKRVYLANMLFPLFVYLHLEVLKNSGKEDAHEFFERHHFIFKYAEGYENCLKELESVENVQNHYSKFWNKKYPIAMPIDIVQDLKHFFEKTGSKSIVFILICYFYFEPPEVKREKDTVFKLPICTKHAANYKDDVNYKYHATSYKDDDHRKEEKSKQIPLLEFDFDEQNVTCVAMNEEKTQVSFAFGSGYIFIADLHAYSMTEENVDQTPLNWEYKQVTICANQSIFALKYVPHELDLLLVPCGEKVVLCNTETLECIRSYFPGHSGDIFSIDIRLTSYLIATGGKDGLCCLKSLTNGSSKTIGGGHSMPINAVKFHPNGLYIVTASFDVRMWKVEDGCPIRCFSHIHVYTMSFSPCGRYLVSGDSSGIINIWDIKFGSKIELSGCTTNENGAKITGLCYSEDGTILVTACVKGVIRLFDLSDLEKKFKTENSIIIHYKEDITADNPIFIKFDEGTLKLISKREKREKTNKKEASWVGNTYSIDQDSGNSTESEASLKGSDGDLNHLLDNLCI